MPGDQDMLNLAFLKGMEEARKFLPTYIILPHINYVTFLLVCNS